MRKLNFTIEDRAKVHTAKIIGVKELPNGEFVEVNIGDNQVLLTGLREFGTLIYNKTASFTSPTFEHSLYSTAEVDIESQIQPKTTGRTMPYVQGFNVSSDGSIGDGIVDYPKHYNGWDFDTLIPFRVIALENNNFEEFKSLYLHHREVVIGNKHYIEYYTKKISLTVKAELKNGQAIPNNPQENIKTDLPSRLIAEFPISISEKELVEHFRLRKEGSEGAFYNSTMMMFGTPATINLSGTNYDTMINSIVYAKANHVPIAHGSDAFISVKYQILHV